MPHLNRWAGRRLTRQGYCGAPRVRRDRDNHSAIVDEGVHHVLLGGDAHEVGEMRLEAWSITPVEHVRGEMCGHVVG